MATPITRYAQNIAVEQIPFANFPGGGPIPGPQGAGFNDPGLEIGEAFEVTAIYQMYGNEVANDVVNLYLAQPGTMVSPVGTVSGSGIAGTATIEIGDDDTTGFGLVSSGVAFGAQPPASGDGADPARYANNLNVATGQTNPVAFAGGSSLANPYQIGALAVEPQGGPAGAGIAGAWVQLKFLTLAAVVPGKVLVVRLKVIKP